LLIAAFGRIVAGAIIFGVTVLVALESRRLEVAIMRQKGIRSIHTYPSYLKVSCPFLSVRALPFTRSELTQI
jgi:hypothetical protein